MYKHAIFIAIFFLSSAMSVHAANTTGHAWSESVGWFDFSSATVGDSSLTGHAYNDNTGWLVLGGVTNSDGQLNGYAWSESVGYFDFSGVVIESGDFSGYAYNDNTGWLSFETGTNVSTTWEGSSGPSPDPEEDVEYKKPSDRSRQKKRALNNGAQVDAPTSRPPQSISVTEVQANASILTSSPDLGFGVIKEEVRILQRFLNAQGFVVNTDPAGPGSIGNETNYFGSLTQQALARFQAAHAIVPSAGYFGQKTKAYIQSLVINI